MKPVPNPNPWYVTLFQAYPTLRNRQRTSHEPEDKTTSETVEEEKIRADYRDGILKIALPKKEQVKPKQIRIEG